MLDQGLSPSDAIEIGVTAGDIDGDVAPRAEIEQDFGWEAFDEIFSPTAHENGEKTQVETANDAEGQIAGEQLRRPGQTRSEKPAQEEVAVEKTEAGD